MSLYLTSTWQQTGHGCVCTNILGMVVFVPTAWAWLCLYQQTGHGCVRTNSVWCVAQYLVMFTFIFIHLRDAFCQTIVVEISATKPVKCLLNTYLSNEETSYDQRIDNQTNNI